MPLADRADCKRMAPGTTVLHKSEDGLNAARTMHGGLIALAAEESVLSLAPGGAWRRWRCATWRRSGSARRSPPPPSSTGSGGSSCATPAMTGGWR